MVGLGWPRRGGLYCGLAGMETQAALPVLPLEAPAMKVEVGPVRPEWAVEPRPSILPIYPPHAFLDGMSCPLCGHPLVNGAAISICDKGLSHATCGGET